MSDVMQRAHFVLPKRLIAAIDETVGPRKRTAFVEAAVEEKLRRERLTLALQKHAGFLKDVETPDWSTSEASAEWVRRIRERDDEERNAFHR
jgi:hypothetical protein